MADPGVLGSQVPPGDDEVWKQIKALEQATQQALAAAASAQALIGLAANQVSTAVIEGSASSFTVTTTPTNFVTVSIPTPTGYTQALITTNGSASEVPAGAANDRLYATLTVAGNTGVTVFGFADSQIGGGVAVTHAVKVTGLTTGVNITSALTLQTLLGPSGTGTATKAVVTMTVIFLK